MSLALVSAAATTAFTPVTVLPSRTAVRMQEVAAPPEAPPPPPLPKIKVRFAARAEPKRRRSTRAPRRRMPCPPD